MVYRIAGVVVVAAVVACDRAAAPPKPPPESQPAPSVTTFNARVAADGEVGFLSHDGKWGGTDSDLTLVFRPQGVVHLTVYGFAVQEYQGTYQIADNGEVTARFPKLQRKWPVLILQQDGDSFVLRPKDPPEEPEGDRWKFRSVRKKNPPDEKR
jgi:hypothetical protein